jgi:hypothetical protein
MAYEQALRYPPSKRSVTLPAGYNPLRVHQVWNTGAATDISVIPE